MKRDLQTGHRESGGLCLEVFTPDELQDVPLGTLLDVVERAGVRVASEAVYDPGHHVHSPGEPRR